MSIFEQILIPTWLQDLKINSVLEEYYKGYGAVLIQ